MRITIYAAKTYAEAVSRAAVIDFNRSPQEIISEIDRRVAKGRNWKFSTVTDVATYYIGQLIARGKMLPTTAVVFFCCDDGWEQCQYDSRGWLSVNFPSRYFIPNYGGEK